MEIHAQAFKQEAYELLSDLEMSLLAVEENPEDMEIIGRIFRALHTIKGSGAMFGFDDIAGFTHEVESVFELVRNGKAPVTKPLIDLTLAAGDRIREMLDSTDGAGVVDKAKLDEIVSALRLLIPKGQPNPSAEDEGSGPSKSNGSKREETFRIRLRPHPDIFSKGANPILLLNELRELGPCKVLANTERIPDLESIDPEQCHIYWDIILTTASGINAIKDVFIFVEDECDLSIELIDSGDGPDSETGCKKLGEILIERGDISREDFHRVLSSQKKIGELLINAGLVDSSKIELALAEQNHLQEVRRKKQVEELASTIRVPAEKLDMLVNLVGELVTVQARLSQTVGSLGNSELVAISEEVERLTAELRDNTMSIRMLPIGTTFDKFKRLVRDLSAELGKDVVMTTDGAETELDKTVIERLNDPLVHLIRNSIDHGIESPQARAAAGKPTSGKIHLSAIHSGAHVLIQVTDDGIGLDKNAILSKALEKGLVSPDSDLSEKEIYSLIFAPGFSTAKEVTSVSGRGVGMDVVKRSIDALRGSIDVKSERGFGTTVTLKLPLTLAIIDGLLVQIESTSFAIPLSVVEECVELTHAEAAKSHGRSVIYVRGEIVPYVRLRESFRIDGEPPEIEQIVITQTGNGRVGMVVDKVIGEHQTVIKNLSKLYRNVDAVSGATILGDGTVAFILDIPKLVHSLESGE